MLFFLLVTTTKTRRLFQRRAFGVGVFLLFFFRVFDASFD